MSSDLAVHACGLSKTYPVYAKPHHRLMQSLDPRRGRRWHNEFHALRPLDLAIRRGETVGIVGRNGSGKSTLLQLICGTLAPTSGSVEVSGRIAALLELGAGFNPDFTGRENAWLNGSVLGLTREELAACFDDIAAFADIGEFMDQPVKSYSSGMYVRLAFAVAINVTPDILIVDEALSVGDEAFQRKCFARIEQIRERGATVLFVSHAAGTVIELCDRAILLDHGEMLAEGRPRGIVARYQKLVYAPADRAASVREEIRREYGTQGASDPDTGQADPGGRPARPDKPEPAVIEQARWDAGLVPASTVVYENRGARIVDPHILTPRGERVNVLVPGDEYVYTYGIEFDQTLTRVRWGMMVRSITGLDIGGCASALAGGAIPLVERGESLTARFRFRCLLAPGVYFANAGVLAAMPDGEGFVDRRIDAAMFRVMLQPGRLATGQVDLDMAPEAG